MADSNKPLTWLVTGSSSGLGLALCRHILSQGHNVIATSRNPARTPDLVREIESSQRGKWITLDVNKPQDEINTIINDAWALYPGGIDVVVNNAAFAVLGALEDIPEAQARANFDTNVFGVLRVCKAVLPGMRRRGSGTIVNVSSAVGLSVWPALGIYSATKFAVESISQALHQEVASFGIRILLPEFGSFRTNFLGDTAMQVVKPSEVYVGGPVDEAIQEEYRKNGTQPGDPEKAIPILFDVVVAQGHGADKQHFMRLPLGTDALEAGLAQAEMVTQNFHAFTDAARSCSFDK